MGQHQQVQQANVQPFLLEAMKDGTELPLGLLGDVLGQALVVLGQPTVLRVHCPGLDLQHRHIPGGIDHHDVQLAVLIALGLGTGPVHAVEKPEVVGQAGGQLAEHFQFGVLTRCGGPDGLQRRRDDGHGQLLCVTTDRQGTHPAPGDQPPVTCVLFVSGRSILH
jgi:hypothetical protein